MATIQNYKKSDLSKSPHTFFNEEMYSILDINEAQQLFKIEVNGKEIWLRAENYCFVPF